MRILTAVLRILMGLLFLFGSITYFFKLITPPPLEGAMKIFNDGIEASVYLMPLVKAVELLCGIAFVVGKYVRLASVLISPIIVNIVLVHMFLAPSGLPIAAFLLVANILLMVQNRDAYQALFKP